MLEASESIITHRRRSTSGEGPAWPLHSATSLLLLDAGNPRSVAFQVARLGDALRLAGDASLVERCDALAATIGVLDPDALKQAFKTGTYVVMFAVLFACWPS